MIRGRILRLWPALAIVLGFGTIVALSVQKCHALSCSQLPVNTDCRKFGAERRILETISSATQEVKLFVGVITTAKNGLARQAIRDTWGSDPALHRVLFFAAKPRSKQAFDALRREAVKKGDVVVLPVVWESYHNITYQTLELLRTAALDTAATHTLKVDDDSYVRVGPLIERIAKGSKPHMLMGFIEIPGGGPHRDPKSPWYVTEEEWPSEKYPPWAHGAAYVISQEMVREIAAGAAMKTNNHQLFKLEDISVGAWVEFVGVEQKWSINYVQDRSFNYNGCSFQDTVSHYVKPRAMLCMHKNDGACCSKSTLSKPHLRGEVGR